MFLKTGEKNMSASTFEVFESIMEGDIDKFNSYVIDGFDPKALSEKEKWNLLHKSVSLERYHPPKGMLKHLIECGVDLNAKDFCNWTPLHFAARSNCGYAVKLFIENGAEVDPVNDEGNTPLQLLLNDDLKIQESAVEALLQKGANPLYKSCPEGYTIREAAEVNNYQKFLSLLDKYK